MHNRAPASAAERMAERLPVQQSQGKALVGAAVRTSKAYRCSSTQGRAPTVVVAHMTERLPVQHNAH